MEKPPPPLLVRPDACSSRNVSHARSGKSETADASLTVEKRGARASGEMVDLREDFLKNTQTRPIGSLQGAGIQDCLAQKRASC